MHTIVSPPSQLWNDQGVPSQCAARRQRMFERLAQSEPETASRPVINANGSGWTLHTNKKWHPCHIDLPQQHHHHHLFTTTQTQSYRYRTTTLLTQHAALLARPHPHSTHLCDLLSLHCCSPRHSVRLALQHCALWSSVCDRNSRAVMRQHLLEESTAVSPTLSSTMEESMAVSPTLSSTKTHSIMLSRLWLLLQHPWLPGRASQWPSQPPPCCSNSRHHSLC